MVVTDRLHAATILHWDKSGWFQFHTDCTGLGAGINAVDETEFSRLLREYDLHSSNV
jgi:hypothetical protein